MIHVSLTSYVYESHLCYFAQFIHFHYSIVFCYMSIVQYIDPLIYVQLLAVLNNVILSAASEIAPSDLCLLAFTLLYNSILRDCGICLDHSCWFSCWGKPAMLWATLWVGTQEGALGQQLTKNYIWPTILNALGSWSAPRSSLAFRKNTLTGSSWETLS